ncbi:MAG: type III secretion system export apparatus subunit SctS [Acidobacteriota bacterium]
MEGRMLNLAQRALIIICLVSAPPVLAATFVGLALAVIQALTQIQEQTLQAALKIVAVFGTLLLLGYWMASHVINFSNLVFLNFARWVA